MIEKKMNELIEDAFNAGEVPIAAIVLKDGKIISAAYNSVETDNDVTSHAEVVAIKQAAAALGNWRLEDCELHCTLEPCLMCKEVIKKARIKKVYYYTKKTYKEGFKTEFVFIENEKIKENFIQKTQTLFGRFRE